MSDYIWLPYTQFRGLTGHCGLTPQYDKGLRGLPHGKTWQVDETGRIRNTQEGVEAFEAWPDPSRPLGKSNQHCTSYAT